ncbi:MAG: prepilin-type N-terminal cleavage/methylation domain-containing protein [Deltaproteobacteria bacterium]|nr:prepilin-type N-terminal cleavage/methylation domain-containing protein [Deltaproteobacteria bacterium]
MNNVTPSKTPRRSRRALRRLMSRARAGLTLIEIMIVIAIIAMIGGGVTYAFQQQKKAQIRTTLTNARSLRMVAQQYYMEHRDACPTAQALISAGEMDTRAKINDEWSKPLVIQCNGDELDVVSGGPDGTIGSGDDITTAATVRAN